MCRRDFKVPDAGIVGFQKNFFIEKLIDLHRLSTCDLEKTCCDVCSDSSKQTDMPSAVMYCIDCSQQLCENCRQSHEKMELTKSHQLIDLKDKVNIDKLARNNTQCDIHKNKPIEMFCFDCKSSNCVICQLESHQGHKCSSVDKVGEDLRIQLDTVVVALSKLLDFSKKETEKLDEKDRKLSEKCLKLRQDIVEQTARIKDTVDQHAAKLMSEIDSIRLEKKKHIEIEKEEASKLSETLEGCKKNAFEMRSSGSALDICRTFHDMQAQAEELKKKEAHFSASDSDPAESFDLLPSDFESKLKTYENVFGKIHCASKKFAFYSIIFRYTTLELHYIMVLL